MKAKKSIRFAAPPPSKATWPSPCSIPSSTPLEPITDICTAIHGLSGAKQIGFLVDESVGQHRHNIYATDAKIQSEIDPKSLEHLLKLSQKHLPGFHLSRRDRLYIAVTLASSVLQLDGTRWLKRQWRSGDIIFPQIEDRVPANPKLDYAHPYVSWKVSPDNLNQSSIIDTTPTLTAHLIRSEALFALGTTLVELCLGQTLSEMQNPEDIDPIEAVSSFKTASRLLDNVYSESGGRYGDVVRRCLFCPFDMRDASLDNEEFQEAVFDSIVTPLMQDLEDFNGSTRIR